MCDYSRREQAMVTIRDGVWCDPCLVPLVRALYENGFPTVASCCGHGKQVPTVCLADGRVVVVLDGIDGLSRVFAAQRGPGETGGAGP